MKINLVNCWSELHLTGPTFICSNFPVIFIEQDVIGCRGACKKSRSTLSIFQLRHTSWRLILSILSYFKGHFLGIGRMNMWGLKVYVWKGPIPNKDNIISMRNSHLVNYYKRWILGTPACWGRYVEYETYFVALKETVHSHVSKDLYLDIVSFDKGFVCHFSYFHSIEEGKVAFES